ncbi:hypothetical protein PENSPDRAFT_695483 [Peniophora sp. CONT]|nr:hypothetical protein PENSPDRAFT_695483 [Peniophora sp. CONT]
MADTPEQIINFTDDKDYKALFPKNRATSPFVTSAHLADCARKFSASILLSNNTSGTIVAYCRNLAGKKITPGH